MKTEEIDTRFFRRQASETGLTLRIREASYTARTVDCSLKGLDIIIGRSPLLNGAEWAEVINERSSRT